jgi:Secretion system C-terminal sorting domain
MLTSINNGLIKNLFFVFVLFFNNVTAQVFGPNSPSVGSNNTSVGANAWTTPGNITVTDNGYSSVSTKGLSNYLQGTNFGFAIPVTSVIDGIRVEIEKKTLNPLNVALLDNWSSGLTKTVSAGANRCLIFTAAIENGTGTRDITGVTYGGQAMTQVAEVVAANGVNFSARIESWILLNAGITAATSTNFVVTYGSHTPLEYCETFSSASFQNVDQVLPVSSQTTSGTNGATNPHQLGSAINTLVGSMAISLGVCGNNTTPASTAGGTNTYSINSTYTEGTDIYFSNPSFSTSGACFQTAHKAITANGTEQPTLTFVGTPNRHSMIGFVLQRARELDSFVRLVKGGVLVGNNYGLTSTGWPTTDAYITYGGPADLWGTTWTVSDINSSNFGAAIAAQVQNGTAQVDHMRITIFVTSTLPISLLNFESSCNNPTIKFNWATASEKNNAFFDIESSKDGISFNSIKRVNGAINSSQLIEYEVLHNVYPKQIEYYRLKQTDIDGQFSYSKIISNDCFEKSSFNVYPNPSANGMFNLTYRFDAKPTTLSIYDVQLKLISYELLTNTLHQIDLSSLSSGAYYAIIDNGEQRHVKLIQKMND